MNDEQKAYFDDFRQSLLTVLSEREARMVEDLKQFMTTTVSQSEARMELKFEKLDLKIEELREEMHQGFAGVVEALETMNDEYDARLTRLEKRAA